MLLETGELLTDVTGQQVGTSRRDLAELDVDAAGRFENATQTDRLGADRPLNPRVVGYERTETLAPRQSQEFTVTAQDVDAFADGAQWASRNHETGTLADGQGSGSSQQVKRHRDSHRGGDPDGKEMQDQTVGTPIPMIDP